MDKPQDPGIPLHEVMTWLKLRHPDIIAEAYRELTEANTKMAAALGQPQAAGPNRATRRATKKAAG